MISVINHLGSFNFTTFIQRSFFNDNAFSRRTRKIPRKKGRSRTGNDQTGSIGRDTSSSREKREREKERKCKREVGGWITGQNRAEVRWRNQFSRRTRKVERQLSDSTLYTREVCSRWWIMHLWRVSALHLISIESLTTTWTRVSLGEFRKSLRIRRINRQTDIEHHCLSKIVQCMYNAYSM